MAEADDVKMPKKLAELIGPPINGHPSNVASQHSKGFQDKMHSAKIGSLSFAKRPPFQMQIFFPPTQKHMIIIFPPLACQGFQTYLMEAERKNFLPNF